MANSFGFAINKLSNGLWNQQPWSRAVQYGGIDQGTTGKYFWTPEADTGFYKSEFYFKLPEPEISDCFPVPVYSKPDFSYLIPFPAGIG